MMCVFNSDCHESSLEHPHETTNLSAFTITNDFAIDTSFHDPPNCSEYDCSPYDSAPAAIHQEYPAYPPSALKARIEGDVWIRVFADTSGRGVYACVSSSNSDALNRAALESIVQWRFTPATLHGKRFSRWYAIPFRFRIN